MNLPIIKQILKTENHHVAIIFVSLCGGGGGYTPEQLSQISDNFAKSGGAEFQGVDEDQAKALQQVLADGVIDGADDFSITYFAGGFAPGERSYNPFWGAQIESLKTLGHKPGEALCDRLLNLPPDQLPAKLPSSDVLTNLTDEYLKKLSSSQIKTLLAWAKQNRDAGEKAESDRFNSGSCGCTSDDVYYRGPYQSAIRALDHEVATITERVQRLNPENYAAAIAEQK